MCFTLASWPIARCPTASPPWPPSTTRPAEPCSTSSPAPDGGQPRRGRGRPRASAAGSPPSTSTGSPTRGCSPSSTAGRRGAAVPAPVAPRSCTGGPRTRWRCRCPNGTTTWSAGCSPRPWRSRSTPAPPCRRCWTARPTRPARRSARPPTTCSRRWRRPGTSHAAGSDSGAVVLGNCPFHRLAQQFTALVCGVNLQLLRGVVDGAGDSSYVAVLDPGPGHCCVRLRPA